ncbi:MAG: DUF6020 family protein [Raoultibacter sp.]
MSFKKSLLRYARRPFDIFALIPALLFSLFTVVGYAFQTSDSFSPLTHSAQAIALSILTACALSVVAYFGLKILFSWLDKKLGTDTGEISFRAILKRRFFIYFLIIFVCWLPWILTNYPGTLRDDSIRQMLQTYAIEPYSNGNPLLDTWIFGLFWQLGDLLGNRALGLYIYGFTQALCTAASFSFMLCYLHKLRAPQAIIYLSVAALALIALFPLAAMSMSKDSINGWLYVLFFVLFVEACRSKGAIFKRKDFVCALIVVTILVVATKKTMLYVVLLAFAAFFIFNKAFRKRSLALFVSTLFVSVLICDSLMPMAMHNSAKPKPATPPSAGTTFILIPLQQTGRLLASGKEIPPEEYQALERLIDCELTAHLYNPRRADEVVWATKEGTDNEDRAAYLGAWAKLGLQNPDTYTAALINQTYGWFCPFWKIEFGYNLTNDVFDEGHMQLWAQYFPGGIQDAEKFLAPLQEQMQDRSPVRFGLERWAQLQGKIPLLTSFGLWCTWILLVGLFYALRKHNTQALIAFVVPVAVVASNLIGPMVLYWYAIPMFYAAPLILCLGCLKTDSETNPGLRS